MMGACYVGEAAGAVPIRLSLRFCGPKDCFCSAAEEGGGEATKCGRQVVGFRELNIMEPISSIAVDSPECRNVRQRRLDLLEVVAVRANKGCNSPYCGHPHVVENYAAFLGAQFGGKCKVDKDIIEAVIPVDKNQVEFLTSVGEMHERRSGFLFNVAEAPLHGQISRMKPADSVPMILVRINRSVIANTVIVNRCEEIDCRVTVSKSDFERSPRLNVAAQFVHPHPLFTTDARCRVQAVPFPIEPLLRLAAVHRDQHRAELRRQG
jgi:hypothetical protein